LKSGQFGDLDFGIFPDNVLKSDFDFQFQHPGGSFELGFSDFDFEMYPVISIQKFTQGGVLNSDSVISILKLPQGAC